MVRFHDVKKRGSRYKLLISVSLCQRLAVFLKNEGGAAVHFCL